MHRLGVSDISTWELPMSRKTLTTTQRFWELRRSGTSPALALESPLFDSVRASPICGSNDMIRWTRYYTVGSPTKVTLPSTPNQQGRHQIRSTCSSSHDS